MLHHSTEYRLNGGAWIQITPDEEAGSGKTFTISGLSVGSYNVEIRLTPLVGGGPSVVSNSFTLNVVSGNYVAQVQLVQSESASASLKFIATSSQSQSKNAEQASSLLMFIGSVAQVQTVQSESGSTSSNVLGSASESQSVQSESVLGIQTFIGSVIQSQTLQTNTATSVENFAGSVAASQNKQSSAIISYETFSGTVSESQLKQTDGITSIESFSGLIAESQLRQSESVSSNAGSLNLTATVAQSQSNQSESISSAIVQVITTASSDNFERADGSLGAIWQVPPSATTPFIANGAATSNLNDVTAVAFYNTNYTADQWASVLFEELREGVTCPPSQIVIVYVRGSGSVYNVGYAALLNSVNGSMTVTLSRRNGTGAQIGTYTLPRAGVCDLEYCTTEDECTQEGGTWSFVEPSILGLRIKALGDVISVDIFRSGSWINNVISVTDSVLTCGQPGMAALNQARITDFACGPGVP